MSIWFAMGTPPTTTDDRLYSLWFEQNWISCAVPAILFGALLIYWLIHRIRAWTAGTPGSPDLPGAPSPTMELPSPPAGPGRLLRMWPLGPPTYA